MKGEKLLSTPEAAKEMGVVVQTIYQWTLAGLPKIRRGRANYYRLSDLKAFRGIIDEAEDNGLEESPSPSSPAPSAPTRTQPGEADDLDGLSGQALKDALTREKARKERSAAQALAVKLEREMGRLLPVHDVEEIVSGLLSRFKASLVNLPITMSPRMALCKDASEAENELERWKNDTLSDLMGSVSSFLAGDS